MDIRRERKDGSLRILENTAINRSLKISEHLNEAKHCGVKTRVQRCFLLGVLKGMQENLEEVAKRYLLRAALLHGLLNLLRYRRLWERKEPKDNAIGRASTSTELWIGPATCG